VDLDLTPRTPAEPEGPDHRPDGTSRPRRARRSPLAVALLVLVLGALSFVVFRGLTNATLYFYNADEAVERRDELGDRRFRLQGDVQDDVVETDRGARFTVAYNGVTVVVDHVGDPPDLFRPGIPVVLEGRWEGDVFASDRMLVKHSEEYKADNPDRVPADSP
jgi:cytochrome c-type biogenesis protein CcmE